MLQINELKGKLEVFEYWKNMQIFIVISYLYMQISVRHIGLMVGIFAVFTSFLFFGRQQETYMLLLLVGLLISCVCFLWILFGIVTVKSKLLGTGIVAVSVVLGWLSESYLIDFSYRIYLHQFRKELTTTNDILKRTSGDVWIMNDNISADNRHTFLPAEKYRLLQMKKKLGTYMILKADSTIYYCLWGFLDVRHGLIYSISGVHLNEQSRHLTGNWYY